MLFRSYEARNLIYIPVMDDELMMIVPLSMFPENKDFDSVSIEKILNLPFIFREEGSGTLESLRLAMEQKGLSLGGFKTLAWIEDSEAIKKMVSIGTGCSFISVKDVGCKDDGIRNGYKMLRIVELDLKRQFYLVYHKSRQLSPLGDNFKSLITNNL